MNQITEEGSVSLLNSSGGPLGSKNMNKDNKNTNKMGYQLDGDPNEGQPNLSSFLLGFHNMGQSQVKTDNQRQAEDSQNN